MENVTLLNQNELKELINNKLPRRVFNGKLLEYNNFIDGSFINLIKLSKPYANGDNYAIFENTSNTFVSSGMYKDYLVAFNSYKHYIKVINKNVKTLKSGIIKHNYI
tara:strand:- start:563 stop:883 length:321 start_codon:yes stop_codon:yes gene_type:complete